MNRRLHLCAIPLLLMVWRAAAMPPCAFGAGDPVVVVLSSDLGPYKEALQGFQKSFGRTVPRFTLSEGKPVITSNTRIVVAIGGKAAHYPYPDDSLLIYCLAPGTQIKPQEHSRRLNVHTSPDVSLVFSKLKELQPPLKRLAVFWSSDSIQDIIDQKNDMAARFGIEMISERIQNAADLPDHLRALKGKVDALWMVPDAVMVTPKNFATIKEFSLANGLPFYVPSDGLVEQGATAAVTASFEEIGQLAAQMTQKALNGSLNNDQVFPQTAHLAINLTAAKACHLDNASSISRQADKVFP